MDTSSSDPAFTGSAEGLLGGCGPAQGSVVFADADGIDDDEVDLGAGVGAAHGPEIDGREHTIASPFHLLKIDAAADVAQKDETLEKMEKGEGRCVLQLGEHQFLAMFKVEELKPDRMRHFGLIVRDEE